MSIRRFDLLLAVALLCLAVSGITLAAAPTILMPDSLKWTAGTGPESGTQSAVLSGNPQTAGSPFVERLKIPAGWVAKPHYHQTTEYVTVISGTMLFGTGDKVDRSQTTTIPVGGFVTIPAHVHHYAIAKTDAIIQVGGIGPDTSIPVK